MIRLRDPEVFTHLRNFIEFLIVCLPSCLPLRSRADSGKLGFLSRPRAGFETLKPLLALQKFLGFWLSVCLYVVEHIVANLASCLVIKQTLKRFLALESFLGFWLSAHLHVIQ